MQTTYSRTVSIQTPSGYVHNIVCTEFYPISEVQAITQAEIQVFPFSEIGVVIDTLRAQGFTVQTNS